MTHSQTIKPSALFCLCLMTLLGCGGGGGFENSSSTDTPTWTQGVYEIESKFKNLCQTPRNFADINGAPYPDKQGSTLHENHWLRSWSNNLYLWYSELPDLDPASYNDPLAYFELLKTSELTSSGTAKDKFHFTMDTTEYEQFTQAGVTVSFGIDWYLTSSTPPRELYIRYIEPGSPADAIALNLSRGTQVLEIDGVNVETGSSDAELATLNAGLSPSAEGESHTFTVLDPGATQPRQVTITATEVSEDPVPIVNTISTSSGDVGYLFFKDHNFVSENKLYEAFTQLKAANVSDLILDLRYNGGGFLYIASQLAYMVTGSSATTDKTFEQIRFNDKHPNTDPVTGSPLTPTPFYATISQYSDTYPQGTPLPQLNLNRIYILSSARTCSASEAIINGLRGIDVEVILVGDTTCGKPYGFYATDNCGTTYFTIQFDGINNKGHGGYSDGFSPMNTSGVVGELVPGCRVNDDLNYSLGATNEPMIAAALTYRESATCPTPPASVKPVSTKTLVSKPQFKTETEQFWTNQKIYLAPYQK